METIGTIHYWKERYEEQIDKNRKLKEENLSMQETIARLSQMVADLKKTIDGIEMAGVKVGRDEWEDHSGFFQCSVCGFFDDDVYGYTHNYCPICGAKIEHGKA